jgi:cobalt-zinc-cadmium resistance protein CzcA
MVFTVAGLVMVAGGLIFSILGGEFIPILEEGDFAVEMRLLNGRSITQTVETSLAAEKILLKNFPEVEQVVARIGASEVPTDPMPMNSSDLIIVLRPRKEWKTAKTREELANKMAEALSVLPGVGFSFQQPVQMRFNELISGAKQDVAIKIFGEDLGILTGLAREIGKIVPTVPGTTDLFIEKPTGLDQIVVEPDRARLARYRISIGQINRTLKMAFAGESAGRVYEGDKSFELVVRLNLPNRRSIEDVRQLPVANSEGQLIPLGEVAKVEMIPGVNQIQRDDFQRRLLLGFNVRGRDVESVVAEMEKRIEKEVRVPAGYRLEFGGQFENLQAAKKRLSVAVPVALALILILLYFSFHSLKQTLVIFLAIPFSAVGGVLALWVRGMPFSVSAGIGVIALFGVAVLNGIVLLAEFNRLRCSDGLTNLYRVILTGTQHRLRPVLITALIASLGFLPMAVSTAPAAEVQKPLATVVIGGLITATFLTLLLLPVIYAQTERHQKKLKGRSFNQLPLYV